MSQITGHPIDPFLTAWSLRGGSDGGDLRLRVYRGLSLPGRWDRERLRVTLQSLLVLNVEQGDRFDDLFVDFFPEEDLPPWLRERLSGEAWDQRRALADLQVGCAALSASSAAPEPQIGAPTSAGEPPTQRPRRRPLLPLLSGLILTVAVVAFLQGHWQPQPRTSPALPPPPGAGAPPVSTFTPPARDGLLLVICAVAALGLWLGLRSAIGQRPVLPTSDRSPEIDEIDLRSPSPPQPFSAWELDDLAGRVGLVGDPTQPRLDVKATAQATARSGGLLTLRFREERRLSRIALVHAQEAAPVDEVTDAIVSQLVAGLQARGVPVSRCHEAQLSAEGMERVLLIHGASEAPIERRPWMDGLPITQMDALSLDYRGFCAAFDALAPGSQVTRSADRPRDAPPRWNPPLQDAQPLAVACALIQPCDLGAIDQLRHRLDPQRPLPFVRLQLVRRQENVVADPAGWRFPMKLLDPGLRLLSPAHRYRLQRTALLFHEQRLRVTRVATTGEARHIRARELALARVQRLWVEAAMGGSALRARDLHEPFRALVAQLGDADRARRVRARALQVSALLPPVLPPSLWAEWRAQRLGFKVVQRLTLSGLLLSALELALCAVPLTLWLFANRYYPGWEEGKRACERDFTRCEEMRPAATMLCKYGDMPDACQWLKDHK